MISLKAATAAGLFMIGAATAATADVVGTLTFDTPTGVVSSTASIPVYVTLALAPTSDPITTDSSGYVTSPLSAQNISDLNGHSSGVIINNSFQCSGTFVVGCGGGASAYNFNFNYATPSFIDPPNFDLQPGHSFDFLFGTFSPAHTSVAPGTYTFYNAITEFEYYDAAANKAYFSTIAQTCGDQVAACAFTRTVTGSVPEPSTWALMLLGFGALGAGLRGANRRRHAAIA